MNDAERVQDLNDRETAYFLKILADYVNGRSSAPGEGVDYARLLDCARKHCVEGVVFHQCRRLLPREYTPRFGLAHVLRANEYKAIAAAAREIEERFTREGVPFFLVKGLEIARQYPLPYTRTMGDLDIVVHTADCERAGRALLDMGFERVGKGKNEREYRREGDGVAAEIHDHLLYERGNATRAQRAYAERAWEHARPLPDTARWELDWTFHMVFLLMHLRKHFITCGVGIRHFLDLTFVARGASIRWDELEAALRETDLLEFAKVCFALCERWFEARLPLHAELDEAFVRESTARVMENGLFGSENSENDDARLINRIRRGGKARAFREHWLPSAQSLSEMEPYAFLKGRPWLLPAAWAYRLLRAARRGRAGEEMDFARRVLASDGRVRERGELMDRWRL